MSLTSLISDMFVALQFTVLNNAFLLLRSSSELSSDSLTIRRGMETLFSVLTCGLPCRHVRNVSL